MRIAYYSHYFSPEVGAPSARIYDLSKQWLALGHKVQVITCFPNHPTGRLHAGYRHGRYMREDLDGIDVHRHWTYITPNKGILRRTLGHVSFYPSALLLSNRRLDPPDVAIGTSPTFFAAMAAASLAKKLRLPFIMEVRDLWPAIFVDLGILRSPILIRRLERWEISLYRRAARIITVTESFRENLLSRGVPADKVVTVFNGADEEFWKPSARGSPLRKDLGLESKFVVLYIGAHGISQGLSSILAAAKMLRHLDQIQFVFVGEGAQKEDLVRTALQENLANVRFLEPVDREKVREYYSAADVCLVPLRKIPLFDTFIPSKLFEIMAMERPVVASVRGEAADLVRRSGAGLVVEPEDSGGIAEAVRTLCEHKTHAREMGLEGRAFVVSHYSRRAQASRYAQVLEETLSDFRERVAK